MGFFDDYEAPAGGNDLWIGKDEKADLIADGTVFRITGVERDESPQYGERFVADVELNGEARKVSFPSGSGVESRDYLLDKLSKYLETPGAEGPMVRLAKAGRAILIEAAE